MSPSLRVRKDRPRFPGLATCSILSSSQLPNSGPRKHRERTPFPNCSATSSSCHPPGNGDGTMVMGNEAPTSHRIRATTRSIAVSTHVTCLTKFGRLQTGCLTQQCSRHPIRIIQFSSRYTEEAEACYALRTASGQWKQTWPCQTRGRDSRDDSRLSSSQVPSTMSVKPQTRRKARRTQAPSEGTQAGQNLHPNQEESDKAR